MRYYKAGPEGIHGLTFGPFQLYWGTSIALYFQVWGYGVDFDWYTERDRYIFEAKAYGRPK